MLNFMKKVLCGVVLASFIIFNASASTDSTLIGHSTGYSTWSGRDGFLLYAGIGPFTTGGVDPRVYAQNPDRDGQMNPYLVALETNVSPYLTVPSYGKYAITAYLSFVSNQTGTTTITSQLYIRSNGVSVLEDSTTTAISGNGVTASAMIYIPTINMGGSSSGVANGTQIYLKIYSACCNQAYFLTGGFLSITPVP